MKCWMYHKEHGGRIFDDAADAGEGWQDNPNFDEPAPDPEPEATLSELRGIAKELGIKVDKRWSRDTLIEKIQDHGDSSDDN